MCNPNKIDCNITIKLKFCNYSNIFQTITDNKLKYPNRNISRAKEVMTLCRKVAKSGMNKFMSNLDKGQILNKQLTFTNQIVLKLKSLMLI